MTEEIKERRWKEGEREDSRRMEIKKKKQRKKSIGRRGVGH